jgi:hypothetical protein
MAETDKQPSSSTDLRQQLLERIEALLPLPGDDLRELAEDFAKFVREEPEIDGPAYEHMESLIHRLATTAAATKTTQARFSETQKQAAAYFEPLRAVHESLYTEMMKWRVAALLTANSAGVLALLANQRLPMAEVRPAVLSMLIGALCTVIAGTALSSHGKAGLRAPNLFEIDSGKSEEFGEGLRQLNRQLSLYYRATLISEFALYLALAAFAVGILTVVF